MAAPSQSRNQALGTKDRITQACDLLQRSLDLREIRSRNIGELLLIGAIEQVQQPENVDHRVGLAVRSQDLR